MPLFTLNWSGKVYSKVCARLMPLFTLKWEGIFKSLCSFNAIIHIEVGRYIQKSVLVHCHYSHWSGKVYSKVCARLMPLFTLNWSGKVYSKVCARLMPLFTLNWSGKVYSKVLCAEVGRFKNAIIHIELKWEGIFKSLCSFNAIIPLKWEGYSHLFTLKWEGIFKSLCSFNAIIHIELKWEGIFKSLCSFNAIIHIEVGRYIQKSVLV